MYQEICAPELMPGPQEHCRDTKDVIAPGMNLVAGKRLQIEFESFCVLRRSQRQSGIGPGGNSDAYVESDRAWQHEALVVVRVFADQVHTAGSAENLRFRVEFITERFRYLLNRHHHLFSSGLPQPAPPF